MLSIINQLKAIFHKSKSHDVALVLGGGGARGYAHIGAIEVLQEYGYNITSVAGTSMGALVGGLYAAGKLQEMKNKIFSLNRRQILSLIDISLGLDHIATGEKLIELLNEMTGNAQIENLPIPFCCSASDVSSGKEYVFREGSLSDAIRASISIPGFFSPVRIGTHIFVDGSVHNTLPLNQVRRHKGDILVAVNASAADEQPFPSPMQPFSSSIRQGENAKKYTWQWLSEKLPLMKSKLSKNYASMAMRIVELSVTNNTEMAKRLTPPDICVDIPSDKFGMLDFDRGREIIEYGRIKMEQALQAFNRKK